MRGLAAAGMILALAAPALARDLAGPAELPPADYAGQQYVDSKGCMFVRAGTATNVVWVPRVARDGEQACGNPPSGRRVPVAEEVGAGAFVPEANPPSAGAADATLGAPATAMIPPGGYFVAIGSFGSGTKSDQAEARLRALGYDVVRGQVQGGSAPLITVFAGPFADAALAGDARQALRDTGFPEAWVMEP